MARHSIYNQNYVMALFDEMAETYGWVNYLSSFGFAKRWRVQCVDQIRLAAGMTVDDWMSGMGETWEIVLRKIRASGCLIAVDFSHGCASTRAANQRSESTRTSCCWSRIFSTTPCPTTLPTASSRRLA